MRDLIPGCREETSALIRGNFVPSIKGLLVVRSVSTVRSTCSATVSIGMG
jgi:hypothetical protein